MAELTFVVRTPHELVMERKVTSARVPTVTGQVGLRPRGESVVLVIESGLLICKQAAATFFVATAGGLLESDGKRSTLYTPYAVAGDSPTQLLATLEATIADPTGEVQVHRQLEQLEQRILQEIGRSDTEHSLSPGIKMAGVSGG